MRINFFKSSISINIILVLTSILLIGNIRIIAQNSFKLSLEKAQIDQLNVSSLNNLGSGLSTTGENLVSFNGMNSTNGDASAFLFGLDSKQNIINPLEISHTDFNIQIFNTLTVGRNYYLLGSASSKSGLGATHLFLSLVSLDSSKIQWTYSIEDQSDSIKRADFVFSNGSFFVVFNKSILPDSNEVRILKISEDGQLIWENKLVGKSGRIYFFENMCSHSNASLYIALKSKANSNSEESEIVVINVDEDGTLLKAAEFEVHDVLGGLVTRHGKVFIKPNGINIHIVNQSFDSRMRLGSFFVSLVDEGLNLKTWRNYSQEMRVEDFQISPGRFLLSGQRPIENGKEGYAMVAINSANAIPELLSSYQSGFLNSTINSNSVVGSNGARTYILVAKSNKSREPYISLALQSDTIKRNCNESFAFAVTKDQMTLTESKDYLIESVRMDIKLEELFFKLEHIVLDKESLCVPNAVTDNEKGSKNVDYKRINNLLVLKFDQVNLDNNIIQIFSLEGKKISCAMEYNSNSELVLDIEKLNSGIYFLKVGQKQVIRFIKI
ncbi:MAG: T9SS type A sorting domain-containing protein [Saprospiraceae bacterium]